MSSLTITINGAVQVLQVGSLGAGASTQIAQAVAATAASVAQAAAYVAELPSLVVQQAATYAALPATPIGIYLVLADETKNGAPTIYLFTASHRYWVAMVQDA